VWRSLKVEEIEMMLLVEHSSTSKMVVPLQPKVRFVGWVKRIDVSEGIIMICADWMNMRLKVSLDLRQIS